MPPFFETLDLIGSVPFGGLCAALAAAIGLADYATVTYRRAPHSVDEMLTCADEVMYAVKGGQRNRVRCIEVD